MMNPDDISRGSLCVLDTNIVIYAEQGLSAQAQRVLRRVAAREITGILPQPAWQELIHRLMLTEALKVGAITAGNPARQLAEKPETVARLALYRDKVKALVEMGIGFEACTRKDLLEDALRIQERYGLLTNDSVLLAVAMRLKADAFITADKDFDPVKEIAVFSPTDVQLPRER
jgi:predicted nucleic acid-binding protein